MKWIVVVVFCVRASNVWGVDHKANVGRSEASPPCLDSLTKAALQSEAKEVRMSEAMIKVTDAKLLGAGAGTFLYRFFVHSSQTADNTHWEMVGELNLENGDCKPVYSKRFEAP